MGNMYLEKYYLTILKNIGKNVSNILQKKKNVITLRTAHKYKLINYNRTTIH